MKLKDGFIMQKVKNDYVIVAVNGSDFSGMVRSNRTAAYVVELLKKDTTEEAIVRDMLARYDAPEEKIRADVGYVLRTLRDIGALEEP